jgi:lipase chaperone LimK
MTIWDLSTGETELLILAIIANIVISGLVGLILVLRIEKSSDQRSLAEHERWKKYLNDEYARILSETEVNQQEIQALVEELRGIASLLREADPERLTAVQAS